MAKHDDGVEKMQAEHRAYRLRQAAQAPAFPRLPVTRSDGEVLEYAQAGMTLREWLAGKAMQGILAGCEIYPDGDADPGDFPRVAGLAVRFADALIAALDT